MPIPGLKQKICQLVAKHQHWHPTMQPIDVYKMLYQSIFGPGHLGEGERSSLQQEYESTSPDATQPLLEPVSIEGDACRINLPGCKAKGIPASAIFDMVRSSVHVWPKRPYSLPQAWSMFRELVSEDMLAFDLDAIEVLDKRLRRNNFPPLHHSASYHVGERPCYRVVLRRFAERLLRMAWRLNVNALDQFLQENYHEKLRDFHVREGYMGTTIFLRTDMGRRLLKVFRRNLDSVEKAEVRHESANLLGTEELPVPRVFYTDDGHTVVSFEDNMVSLMAYSDGLSFTPGDIWQLHGAGRVLARMHLVGHEWPVLKELEWEPYELATLGAVCARLQKIRTPPAGELAEPISSAQIADFREKAKELGKRMDNLHRAELFRTMIHGDYRAQNVLFEGDHVSAVLDFDFAWPAAAIHDICYALVFFQAVVAPQPLSLQEMEAFLRGYREERPLSSTEIAALPPSLELAFLRGMSLWLHIYYVDGLRDRAGEWISNYLPFLPWLLDNTREIQKKCS